MVSFWHKSFAGCLCSEFDSTEYSKTTGWKDIGRRLALLYNEIDNYTPQYEGYDKETIIKQADVVLLGFPLQYPLTS